jgi:hypothetical protein
MSERYNIFDDGPRIRIVSPDSRQISVIPYPVGTYYDDAVFFTFRQCLDDLAERDARIAELSAPALPVVDEGKLWSLIRNVLQQGVDIHLDHCGLGYEKYSARLDAAAAERITDFAKLGPTLGLVTREEMAREVEAAYREGYHKARCDGEIPDKDRAWKYSAARKRLEGGR